MCPHNDHEPMSSPFPVPDAFAHVAPSVPGVLCLWTWVTVLCQDIGDTSVGSGGDTCGLRLSGEL